MMINQKTNYPNYSRSLLFEIYCYDDEMTKKNFSPRFNSLIYMKIIFNKNGFGNSLCKTKLNIDKWLIINFCILSIYSSALNWKTEFVKYAW